MKFKRLLKIFLVIFLAGTLVYIFSGIKGKAPAAYVVESSADGKGMEFTHYNDENKKDLELKCTESVRESNDKILMKNIQGLIPKKGRMNKDIKVFGDEGFVENNYHNFYFEKNARLASEDFIVSSDNFTLKSRAELHSAPHVSYQTETLKGRAKNGMGLYLNVNTLKFHNTTGTYKRDNRTFSYQTDVMWIIEGDKVIVLEKNVLIKDEQSILRSDWLTLKFDEEMKQIVEASSQKNSYFYAQDREKNEIKEIRSGNITGFYDKEGHLTQLKVMENGEVLLKSETNHTLIKADNIEMNFDGPSGIATDIKIPLRGIVDNTGETSFRVLADTIDVKYDQKGEISHCEGTGNVEFIVEEYKGVSEKIIYNIKRDSITLEGENSQITHKNNTFTSSRFRVKVADKQLLSNDGVKSLIRMEEENALFSLEPIFINSRRITLFEKENRFKYEGQVNLKQEDTQLSAGSLEIGEGNSISAEGRVALEFMKGDKDVALQGGELNFDPGKKQINIIDNAVIKSGESILRAARFEMIFNDKNEIDHIAGEEDIYFTKDDLSGTSRRVKWLFNQEIMILKGAPEIINQNGGKTTGKELEIHLQDNSIRIISDPSDRTETIIRQ